MSSSIDFAALQVNIISTGEQDSGRKPDYSRAFPFQGYFITFGSHSTFDPEINTWLTSPPRIRACTACPRFFTTFTSKEKGHTL